MSYSSRDRDVAERVRDALEAAGYGVFWDQSTPAGQDWDSWIREQLLSARLVVALWTRASVASPNVRHEAIIAREQDKLLPIMADELTPTDFPMGLFMVQALMIGRSARDFEEVRERFLDEVRARIGGPGARTAAAPLKKRKHRRRRWLAIGLAALLAALSLYLAWPRLMFALDPDAPPISREHLEHSIASESLARERVARGAEGMISTEGALNGSDWAWGAGQLIAGAPRESRDIAPRYFSYLAQVQNTGCHCFHSDGVPHSIGNAWVIMAAARLGRPPPDGLLETILDAQHPEGWWAISLNAVRSPDNAAVHPTAILTIALAEARRAGIVPPALRGRVDTALRRSVAWLNRGPEDGNAWSDYPNNGRRTENLVFAAMAAVATHVAGGAESNAARAFIRAVRDLPEPPAQFASGAYVPLTTGGRFFDDYRHPTSPWTGAAAAMTYYQAGGGARRTLRDIVRQWLDADLSDEKLLRQDWTTGETLYLRDLAFRDLGTALDERR
ncbi:MAG TPA: toll/interleukin-1 receptor domain-containing protein [Allosphingosinicella sp.]|nr:toll/interleukin-1 receptor domain-containing protein [Allosphingosinicella sp.]